MGKIDNSLYELDETRKEPWTQYEVEKARSKYVRFKEIVDYDFKQEVYEQNVGDEARTFHISNKQKPLLSPSRLLKVFTEHKFFVVPSKNILIPRLFGSITHYLMERWLKYGEHIKVSRDNLEILAGEDYETLLKKGDDVVDLFIEDLNEASSNIYNFLKLKKIKIIDCEKYVCNQEYHGFIDMVGYKWYQVENGGIRVPVLIDLKITKNDEITNDYYLQLAIYRQILEKTTQCYILFYNRDTKKCRLEKAKWSKLDKIYESINYLVEVFRNNKDIMGLEDNKKVE